MFSKKATKIIDCWFDAMYVVNVKSTVNILSIMGFLENTNFN